MVRRAMIPPAISKQHAINNYTQIIHVQLLLITKYKQLMLSLMVI